MMALSASNGRFASVVRLFVAPVLTAFGGFITADFLLHGVYTWPRTSRIFVLSLTLVVLTYEFIYKEQRLLYPEPTDGRPLKAVFSSCVAPYALGMALLFALARLTH